MLKEQRTYDRRATWVAVLAIATVLVPASRGMAQDAVGPTAPREQTADADPAAAPDEAAAEPAEAAAEPAETAEEAAPPDSVEVAREALRNAHLGELASRTRAALQRARPLGRPTNEINDIARRLPRAEAEVERMCHPIRVAHIAQLSQREIVDQRQESRRYANMFEEWQATLLERGAAVEEVRTEIVALRRSWAELRDTSIAAGSPEGRHERITTSLEQVRSSAQDLDAQRELLLELQDRVSELSIAVEDLTEQLRAAGAAYRDRLFVRDRPPLWMGLGGDEGAGSLASQARESLTQRTDAATAMIDTQIPALLRQLALFALLAGLMLVLSRRSRSWSKDDETIAIARRIVQRPLSIALFVTLLLTPFAVRHAPVVLYDVLFFLSLVPLARVLAPLTPSNVRPLLYALAVFLAIDRIEVMAPNESELRRALLVVESTAAVIGLVCWVHFRGRATDRLTSVLRGIATLSAIIVATALVANVIGYRFLATMLMRGTSFSAFAGLVIVATILLVQSMLDLALRSTAGQQLYSVREHGALMHQRALRALVLTGLLLWIAATLAGFGVLPPLSKWLEDSLAARWEVGSINLSMGAIGLALLVLAVTVVLARLVKFVLELDVLPRMRLEPGVDGAISGITRYLVVGTGLLLAMASLGIDASQIALVAGALGVGIGFGLQGIVANFIAGLVLMLERPVRLRDFIEVGPLVGRVERIGLRSSTVRGFDGAEVIVPNEALISREVVNWTLSDRKRRLEVKVGVVYGTDANRVLEVIRVIAAQHVEAVGDAVPEAFFAGFGDAALEFVLQFWTADFGDPIGLRSEVALRIHEGLAEAGIQTCATET